jgi:hypothetical protein
VSLMLRVSKEELVLLSLGLLDTILSGAFTINNDDVPLLTSMLPQLETLAAHSNANIAVLAEDLRISIATRDASWTSAPQSGADADSARQLDTVLDQLCDNLLPVRAHALGVLRRMVLAKVRAGGRDG